MISINMGDGSKLRRGAWIALLLAGMVSYALPALAEQKKANTTKRSPKCESEYQQCSKNCDKTQVDVGNQIQNCKDQCAKNTDLFCSRTLTGTKTKSPVTKAPAAGATVQAR